MADRDALAERARLQAIAYGGSAPPEAAARAARALHDLDAAAAPRAVPASTGAAAAPQHPATDLPEVGAPAGAAPALPGEASEASATAPRTTGRPPWRRRGVRLGALVAAPTLAAFGIGLLVGSGQRIGFAPTVTTPEVGVSIAAALQTKQSLTDEIPTAIIGTIRPSSTRLVFSNRSLSGDDAMTPWDVYVGEARDPTELCLVATANGLTSTTICFPRARAAVADLQFVARIASGTLTVTLDDGVLTGRAR